MGCSSTLLSVRSTITSFSIGYYYLPLNRYQKLCLIILDQPHRLKAIDNRKLFLKLNSFCNCMNLALLNYVINIMITYFESNVFQFFHSCRRRTHRTITYVAFHNEKCTFSPSRSWYNSLSCADLAFLPTRISRWPSLFLFYFCFQSGTATDLKCLLFIVLIMHSNFFKVPEINLIFQVLCFFHFRHKLIPRIIPKKYLEYLDG